ncbi:hypothetical protein CLF_113026 [Clonorchis sinensis]|uniref:Uncharacterized protein n=1 Tax=Clonorchis sinensis TaxID=79923 RepID=G7YXH4_CLOSI|nr:hypothetical protein CLF_113026 [Clonorchis sinensis]
MVVMDSCALKSTTTRLAVTTDCSFYSTIAHPSTTNDTDARIVTSFKGAERPTCAELSPLISLVNDKGLAVSSTPKPQVLSWFGVAARKQASKPTGGSAASFDFDVGDCREIPTTTENLEFPASSSTLSKVVHVTVDSVITGGHGDQSNEANRNVPETSTCIELVTLIADDLTVDKIAKASLPRPNRPHKLCLIEKMPAVFKLRFYVKTILLRLSSKETWLTCCIPGYTKSRKTREVAAELHATLPTQIVVSDASRPTFGNAPQIQIPFQGFRGLLDGVPAHRIWWTFRIGADEGCLTGRLDSTCRRFRQKLKACKNKQQEEPGRFPRFDGGVASAWRGYNLVNRTFTSCDYIRACFLKRICVAESA